MNGGLKITAQGISPDWFPQALTAIESGKKEARMQRENNMENKMKVKCVLKRINGRWIVKTNLGSSVLKTSAKSFAEIYMRW